MDASKATWDHPLECGHTVRDNTPKLSRRTRYYCITCRTTRRLGTGTVTYNPAPASKEA